MDGAQAGDYRVAAGAALSVHKFDLADQFLGEVSRKFPHDAGLMHMNARQDIARGNYDEGEQELRSALVAVREQETSVPAGKVVITAPARKCGRHGPLSAHDGPMSAAGSTQAAAPCKPETPGRGDKEARIGPAGLCSSVSHGQTGYRSYTRISRNRSNRRLPPQQPEPTQPDAASTATQPNRLNRSSSPSTTQPPQLRSNSRRNNKWRTKSKLSITATRPSSPRAAWDGRIGDPGIDQLIIGDMLLGSAYTSSNRVRLGIEAHGVFAFSGTPDGSSTLMFGTLPAGAVFGEQSKIGYSGLAQLSTKNLGMAFGTTPQGFAVHNLIGGIHYRPAQWLVHD